MTPWFQFLPEVERFTRKVSNFWPKEAKFLLRNGSLPVFAIFTLIGAFFSFAIYLLAYMDFKTVIVLLHEGSRI